MQRSGYIGPAPITVDKYRELINLQSVKNLQVGKNQMDDVFNGVVIKPFLKDRLGSAMHSGKAIFIYGPAGTGKTFICKKLIDLLQTPVYIFLMLLWWETVLSGFSTGQYMIL